MQAGYWLVAKVKCRAAHMFQSANKFVQNWEAKNTVTIQTGITRVTHGFVLTCAVNGYLDIGTGENQRCHEKAHGNGLAKASRRRNAAQDMV